MKNKSELKAYKLLNDESLRKTSFSSSKGIYPVFIFLCGKKKEPADNREQIAAKIINKRPFRFSVYSEDIFPLFADTKLDLLSFEEILSNISSKIIILVESFGSACELGAFSLLDKGLDKLLIINDVLHKDNDSFIEKGPLKKIKDNAGDNHVLYEKFNSNGELVFSQNLMSSINNISRLSFPTEPFKNKDNYRVVSDVGLVACLLFEYVMRFGYIRESSVEDVIQILIMNKQRFPILIKFQSGNEIKDKKALKVLTALPQMLKQFGLFCEQIKGFEKYYHLNTSLFKSIDNGSAMTSLLFYADEPEKRSMRVQFSRIKNQACKEGYLLWRND